MPCTQRALGGRIVGVVPGAGGELRDGWQRAVEDGAGQALTAVVEDAHDVAVGDPARGCVLGAQADRLAALHLAGLAVVARVELAVQAPRRVVGDEQQGNAGRGERCDSVGSSHAAWPGASS